MKIARLSAYHVRIPLRYRVSHASHSREANDTLLVSCELDDGTSGWGEGLPRPYVTGESIESAWAQLRSTDIGGQLNRRTVTLSAAIEMLTALQLAPPLSPPAILNGEPATVSTKPSSTRDCFGNSVRCAIELSVLDAVCRAAGVPLSHVTSLLPDTKPIRQAVSPVRYSGVMTAMTPLKQLRSALKLRLYGFHQCKVKVGVSGSDDVTNLRRVRRILGPRVDLRIDANEAWTCAELPEKLEALQPFGITAVEQPVPHEQIADLADVRPHLGVPVMLDESVCSLSEGRRAIDAGLCDLFNIRLSKCGGFLNSLRLAAMAHAAGLGSQLGCQVGETGVLSSAGRHFAASVAGLRYLEGSYDRHLVRERLTVEDVTFGYGGRAPALTAPGLGITVNRAAVARCTVRQLVLWE